MYLYIYIFMKLLSDTKLLEYFVRASDAHVAAQDEDVQTQVMEWLCDLSY